MWYVKIPLILHRHIFIFYVLYKSLSFFLFYCSFHLRSLANERNEHFSKQFTNRTTIIFSQHTCLLNFEKCIFPSLKKRLTKLNSILVLFAWRLYLSNVANYKLCGVFHRMLFLVGCTFSVYDHLNTEQKKIIIKNCECEVTTSGIHSEWIALFIEINESNLTKLQSDGQVKRGEEWKKIFI